MASTVRVAEATRSRRSALGMLDGMQTSETMNAMPGGPASLVVAAGDGPDC